MHSYSLDLSQNLNLGSNVFYRTAWLRVLQDTYGFDFEAIKVDHCEYPLVYARIKDLIGERIVSLPFSDYTIPPMDSAQLKEVLYFLKQENPSIPISLKLTEEFFDCVPESYSVGREMVYHIIPINEEHKFSSSFKRGIKKAEKSGIEVKVNTEISAIHNYYQLHSGLRVQKFKSLPQPLDFFQNIHKYFFEQGQGLCLEAYSEGQIAASILILKDRDTWVYKFGASHPEYLEERPNNLLFKTLIAMAKEEKVKSIDLGISGAGSDYEGLRRFKNGMGGVQSLASSFGVNPDGALTTEQLELKTLFGKISKAIAHNESTIEASKEAGSLLYRFFT